MKRIVYISLALSIICNLLIAQTNNIENKANSSNNGNGKLWDNVPNSNNIYKTPISGNVGIGTNNPQHPLDIKGELVVSILPSRS